MENKDKIRVLYLIEGLARGGAERRLINDLKNLNKDKFETVVVSVTPRLDLLGEIKSLNIKFYSLDYKRAIDIFKVLFKLIGIIKENRIDILHTQLFFADFFGRIASVFFPKLICISTIQNALYSTNFYSQKRKIAESLSGKLFCDYFIAVSEFTKESVVKELGFDRNKVFVIYNYIDVKSFGKWQPRLSREALGFKESDKIFIIVSRLTRWKGHRTAIEAFGGLNGKFPEAKLLIAGSGPEEGMLKALSDSLGLGNVVKFLGQREDVPDLLGLSDVFLFPSLCEGFSLAVLEAMAMKKLCIASDISQLKEAIKDGRSGLLFKAKDARHLENVISEYLGGNLPVQKMTEEAFKNTQTVFDKNQNVALLENLYLKLYSNRS